MFDTDDDDAITLAEFIADDIEEYVGEGRSADDFALLVRVRANQIEDRLKEPFAARGLRLRNEARLVGAVVEALGEKPLQRTFRQCQDERYIRSLQSALVELLKEYAPTATDWPDLIDAVEGKGEVRLMTIHKSKGLEYHTVIFVGLHQNVFWGYKNNRAEETNNFFVAF